MRLSDRLQGLCAQSWAKTGLGKKPYNARKYGISKFWIEGSVRIAWLTIVSPLVLGYFVVTGLIVWVWGEGGSPVGSHKFLLSRLKTQTHCG